MPENLNSKFTNNPNDSSSSFSNENELLEIINFKDIWRSLLRKKKWFFISASVIFTGSIFFTIYSRIYRPIYRGSFTLLIIDPMSPKESKNDLTTEPSTFIEDIAISSNKYEIPTLVTLLKSPLFLNPVAKKYNLSYGGLSNKILLNQFGENVDGSINADGILNVELYYHNKKVGLSILEDLAKTYLEASLNRQQQRLKDGLNFLNDQAPEIISKTNMLETKLVEFREKNKLIEPALEGGSLKEQQVEIDSQIIEIKKEMSRLSNIKDEIKKGTLTAQGYQQELRNGLSITDIDQGLLIKLTKLENELAETKLKFNANSDIVKGLESRLNQIKPRLLKKQLEAVDLTLKLNQGKLISNQALKKELEEKFLKQPQLIKDYRTIERELEISNQNLLSLVKAKEKFQLQMAQKNIPWRIISKPKVTDNPIKPSINKNLQTGLIISLLFGSIIALLRDRFDNVFHYSEEVKDFIDLPILGNLPFVDKFKEVRETETSILEDLVNVDTPENNDYTNKDAYQRFFYQEAFRNLCTSIRFLDGDRKVKTLLVTSSEPKEGKTLVNILLAKTLSDLDQRVLLIDADLRKPKLHRRLGLNNILGFSNILSDENVSLKQVVQNVEGINNFNVITGGTLPPDPTRLLSSKRLKKIIENLQKSEEFDLIIFDSAPIMGLADSLLLSPNIDGVMVLVGLNKVDRRLPRETINRLRSVGTNIFGIITNDTKSHSTVNQYGYYKYSNYGGSIYQPYKTYQSYMDTNDTDKVTEDIELDNSEKTYINITNKLFKRLNKNLKKFSNKVLNWLDS